MRIQLISLLYFFPVLFSPELVQEERKNVVASKMSGVIYQSSDAGQTWQDISEGLPEEERPDDFFAGESYIFLRSKGGMFRSKSNLKAPVWQKEDIDPKNASITFNRSGIIAYNYDGEIYHNVSSEGTWLPVLTSLKTHSLRGIFEVSDGSLLMGCDSGLYKSADNGKSWRQIKNGGWVIEIVESEGVLVATSQGGILRSTDKGETWQWVIQEGGVGIDVASIKGGFAAIVFNTTTQARTIHLSQDNGKSWKAIDDGIPPSMFTSSVEQMGDYLICGHPDGIFRSSDLGKTWSIVHPNVEKKVVKYGNTWNVVESRGDRKVFKVYSAGNVLYAVVRPAGC